MASGTVGLAPFTWKDLNERMNLHSLEYSKKRIGILSDKLFSFFSRVWFDDDQAAYMIGHRACKNDPTTLVPAFYFRNMGGAVDLSQGLAVRSIEPEDDELQCHVVEAGPPQDLWKVSTGCVSDRGFFQRVPIFVSQAYLMPPPDFGFAKLPAEIDDAPIKKERKVAQAHIDIFHDHP
jgi:hypothetical protein